MLRTIEATIDEHGNVKLAEAITLAGAKRALVTILDEDRFDADSETMLLSEASLADEWLTPEEDEAWKDLADLPDLDKESS